MNMYPLINVSEPNLIKNTFPYSLPPLIKFEDNIKETVDGKEIEFDPRSVLKRDIHITDTTFRDGQQSRPPYSTEQITNSSPVSAGAKA